MMHSACSLRNDDLQLQSPEGIIAACYNALKQRACMVAFAAFTNNRFLKRLSSLPGS